MNQTAFIVKDHKTYMNAEEAWFTFKNEKVGSVLFIITPMGDPANVKKTLTESIDDSKWENVVWFSSFSNYDTKSFKAKKKKYRLLDAFFSNVEYLFNKIDVLRINKLAENFKNIDTVFTGHRNMQEHLAACLTPKEMYIMDSGQTLDKIRKSGYIDYRYKYYGSRFKKLMLKLTGLNIVDRKSVKLFTVYSESAETKHQIIKNEQNYKKQLIKKKDIGSQVLFISSPFYKFKKNISIETYIEYINRVMQELGIENQQLVYIPNPIRESDDEIRIIVNRLGCECDDRLLTVEAKVTAYETLPAICISPCSTALVNIDILSEGKIKTIAAWHPEFNCFRFLHDWKEDVLNDKKRNVQFIEINNLPPFFNFDMDKLTNTVPYNNLNDV